MAARASERRVGSHRFSHGRIRGHNVERRFRSRAKRNATGRVWSADAERNAGIPIAAREDRDRRGRVDVGGQRTARAEAAARWNGPTRSGFECGSQRSRWTSRYSAGVARIGPDNASAPVSARSKCSTRESQPRKDTAGADGRRRGRMAQRTTQRLKLRLRQVALRAHGRADHG